MTREEISEYNEEALICDGFDEAIIGVAERINLGPVAAYSVEKIIEILNQKTKNCLGEITNILSKQLFPLSAHLNTRYFENRSIYIVCPTYKTRNITLPT